MIPYSIRQATINDLPALRKIWQEYVTWMTADPDYYPRAISADVDSWTRAVARAFAQVPATTFVFLAHRDEDILAFLLWEHCTRLMGEPHEFAYCHHLFVRPGNQGMGIGPALSEVYCEHALAQGLTECEASYYPGTTWVASHPYDLHSIRGHMPIGRLLAHFDKRRAHHAVLAAARPIAAPHANGHDVDAPLTPEQPEPRLVEKGEDDEL